MTGCIVGWAHTPFGRLDAETVESLIVRVATDALADAGIAPADVDEIVLGHFNAGFSAQDFTASLVLQASPDLRFKRATRVENACATGSAAVHQGLQRARGEGRAHRARGRRRADDHDAGPGDRQQPAQGLLCARRGRYRGRLRRHFRQDRRRAISRNTATSPTRSRMIAAKNHKNGVGNPYAQMRKDLGYEFCRRESEKNPFVAGPAQAHRLLARLRRRRRGGARRRRDRAAAWTRRSRSAPPQHVQDFLPMAKRDILKFEGCAQAWQRALAQAGIALTDLSFVETHDCFTIAELIEYEAMGLAPEGQGARAIEEGLTQKDGKLPVNPSGGLKAKGHPIGATGVSMHALAAMQLTGTAGDIQVQRRAARRHLQHGRRRGRELREHAGAHQVMPPETLENPLAASLSASRSQKSRVKPAT